MERVVWWTWRCKEKIKKDYSQVIPSSFLVSKYSQLICRGNLLLYLVLTICFPKGLGNDNWQEMKKMFSISKIYLEKVLRRNKNFKINLNATICNNYILLISHFFCKWPINNFRVILFIDNYKLFSCNIISIILSCCLLLK